MSKKIEKLLEKKSDERGTLENGKIYKKILEIIVVLTNLIYFISRGFGNVLYTCLPGEIIIELLMIVINLSTFIGVITSIKKRTVEGSISKTTYLLSTFHVINIYNLIILIIKTISSTNKVLNGYLGLIGGAIMFAILVIENIYMSRKVKQL